MGLVGIEWKFPKWERKMKESLDEINLVIAASMQTNRGLLFDAEGNYNGHQAWPPLRLRDGMILSNRGTLRKSLAPPGAKGTPGPSGIVRFDADTITIGTTLAYARLMNWGSVGLPGGVVRAKTAKALKIPLPQGTKATEGASQLQEAANRADAAKRISVLQDQMQKTRSDGRRMKLIHQIAAQRMRLKRGHGAVKWIFRKWVRVPPRPFDTWTDEDQHEFELTMKNKIIEVLNRG